MQARSCQFTEAREVKSATYWSATLEFTTIVRQAASQSGAQGFPPGTATQSESVLHESSMSSTGMAQVSEPLAVVLTSEASTFEAASKGKEPQLPRRTPMTKTGSHEVVWLLFIVRLGIRAKQFSYHLYVLKMLPNMPLHLAILSQGNRSNINGPLVRRPRRLTARRSADVMVML